MAKFGLYRKLPLIVLLTDFGFRDHYVGVMKGVISSITPEARIVDLSHNVMHDSVPRMRRQNLQYLLERCSDRPEAKEAARSNLGDSDPEVRLACARFLGDEATEALFDLIDTDVSVNTRAGVIDCLAGLSSHERVFPVLERFLDSKDEPIVQAAARGIGRLRYQPAVPKLVRLVQRTEGPTAMSLARALRRIKDPSSEDALVCLLERKDVPVLLEVVKGLGEFGSIKAVEPMLRLTKGVRLSTELKESTRRAIFRIQERMGDVDAGRLSVAGSSDEQGRVSLIVDGGALAVADISDEPKDDEEEGAEGHSVTEPRTDRA